MGRKIIVIEQALEGSGRSAGKLATHWAVGISGYGILESGTTKIDVIKNKMQKRPGNHEWTGTHVGYTDWTDDQLDSLIDQWNTKGKRGGTRDYDVHCNNCQTAAKWIVRSIGGDESKCPATSHGRLVVAGAGGVGAGFAVGGGAVVAGEIVALGGLAAAGPVGWFAAGAIGALSLVSGGSLGLALS